MAAPVTREEALCAAQAAMNKLLQAAGVTCDTNGTPVITEKPTGSDDYNTVYRSAMAALTAIEEHPTEALIAAAVAAVEKLSILKGANKVGIPKYLTVIEKAKAKLAAVGLLQAADDAIAAAEKANEDDNLTKEQRDAAERTIADYGAASGHATDQLGLLTTRLEKIPTKYPGDKKAAAADAERIRKEQEAATNAERIRKEQEVAAKKTEAESELTKLSNAAGKALTVFRGTREKPEEPLAAAEKWVDAAKTHQALLGESIVGTAEEFLEQVKRVIMSTAALKAEEEFISLGPYVKEDVIRRNKLQELARLANEWREAETKKQILNGKDDADKLVERIQQLIKREDAAIAAAEAKSASSASSSSSESSGSNSTGSSSGSESSSSGSSSSSTTSGSSSKSSSTSKKEITTEEDLNTAIEELALLSGIKLKQRKLYLNNKVDALVIKGDKDQFRERINKAEGKQSGGRRRTRNNKRKARRTTRRS